MQGLLAVSEHLPNKVRGSIGAAFVANSQATCIADELNHRLRRTKTGLRSPGKMAGERRMVAKKTHISKYPN